MSAQHTPGPWVYENGYGVIACGNPLKVSGRTQVAKANRALIAAAPELLAVSQAMLAMLEDGLKGLTHPVHGRFVAGVSDIQITPDGGLKLSDARAAIAKATGA